MTNENLLDQFFLTDKEVVKKLVQAADIKKSDLVLEIGAGTGIVTTEIAKFAGKVIAVEIDNKFKDALLKMPQNVRVVFDNALKVLENKPKFNKIVASLPSSIVEPLIWQLTQTPFEIAALLIPLKFVEKLLTNQIFNLYLKTILVEKIAKQKFDPKPKTNWAIVKMVQKENALKVADYERFILQYIFEHKQAKVKNSLMEAVIKISVDRGKKLTKNQARAVIDKAEIASSLLEQAVVTETDLLELSSVLKELL